MIGKGVSFKGISLTAIIGILYTILTFGCGDRIPTNTPKGLESGKPSTEDVKEENQRPHARIIVYEGAGESKKKIYDSDTYSGVLEGIVEGNYTIEKASFDPDGDILKSNLTGLEGLVTNVSGNLVGAHLKPGKYTIGLRVDDGKGKENSTDYKEVKMSVEKIKEEVKGKFTGNIDYSVSKEGILTIDLSNFYFDANEDGKNNDNWRLEGRIFEQEYIDGRLVDFLVREFEIYDTNINKKLQLAVEPPGDYKRIIEVKANGTAYRIELNYTIPEQESTPIEPEVPEQGPESTATTSDTSTGDINPPASDNNTTNEPPEVVPEVIYDLEKIVIDIGVNDSALTAGSILAINPFIYEDTNQDGKYTDGIDKKVDTNKITYKSWKLFDGNNNLVWDSYETKSPNTIELSEGDYLLKSIIEVNGKEVVRYQNITVEPNHQEPSIEDIVKERLAREQIELTEDEAKRLLNNSEFRAALAKATKDSIGADPTNFYNDLSDGDVPDNDDLYLYQENNAACIITINPDGRTYLTFNVTDGTNYTTFQPYMETEGWDSLKPMAEDILIKYEQEQQAQASVQSSINSGYRERDNAEVKIVWRINPIRTSRIKVFPSPNYLQDKREEIKLFKRQ